MCVGTCEWVGWRAGGLGRGLVWGGGAVRACACTRERTCVSEAAGGWFGPGGGGGPVRERASARG